MQPIDFFVENKSVFILMHVIVVIVGMGSAIASDLVFNFFAKDKVLSEREQKVLKKLSAIVWYSIIFIIISGVALFFSDPERYMASHKFISKMFIFVVLLVNGYVLQRLVQPHLSDPGLLNSPADKKVRQIAFACGAISLVSWITVCTLGILDSIPVHFVHFVFYYFVFTLCAIAVALFVEKKTFN